MILKENCGICSLRVIGCESINDNFSDLYAVAAIGAISVANNAMYAGIVDVYGDEIDAGAAGITTLSG